jgi:serine/threonine protein kinase
MTSDGLPQSEMTACLRAGQHANLIPLLGKVDAHPAGVSGLVMALIDPAYTNLAGPPSLDSCSRDIYPPDLTFELTVTLRIVLGIASAARHLHAQGLMHGDLYAHNILHNGQGSALLGDLGVASFLASQDQTQSHALQRIEVRAFACLLGELLARCPTSTDSQASLQTLTDLKTACLSREPCARPLFADIEQTLLSLLRSNT